MAIKLRDGEQIQAEAQLHRSVYIIPGIWAAIMGLSALLQLFADAPETGGPLMTFLLGFAPILYVHLKQKSKTYAITNERLYVEEGIFSKSRRDIPLDKINNFETTQGLVQRMFDAGDVLVLTGNNKPITLMNISKPEEFREAASKLISTKRAV